MPEEYGYFHMQAHETLSRKIRYIVNPFPRENSISFTRLEIFSIINIMLSSYLMGI